MKKLFPYQEELIQNARRAISRAKSVIMVLPTGGGKTLVAANIARLAAQKNKRVLFLAHRIELVSQISATLTDVGVEHGVIAVGKTPDYALGVQVAMVGTLLGRLRNTKMCFDLVIIDEAHHAAPSSQYHRALEKIGGDAKLIGITATPCRLDGKPLGREHGGLFDDIVTGPSAIDLIDLGRLVEPVIYAPPMTSQMKAFIDAHKAESGDYKDRDIDALMSLSGREIIGSATGQYRRVCHNAPAILFSHNVRGAEMAAEQFREAGYQAAALSGKTKPHVRAKMLEDLQHGRLNVLTSCNTVCEGTDIPAVVAAIMLRMTKSQALYLQQAGRALRAHRGKDRAFLLDHVGVVAQHGSPLNDIEWSLHEAPKVKSKREARDCPYCYASIPANALQCPECLALLAKLEIEEEKPRGEQERIVFDDEELMQIDNGAEAVRRKREMLKNATTHKDFLKIANEFGYKKGWAWHRYNDYKNRISSYAELLETRK